MKDIVGNRTHSLYPLEQSQDFIGWNRFMEGMISKEITGIQKLYLALSSYHLSIERWMIGLITKLLEVTHEQLLYRNANVHDSIWPGQTCINLSIGKITTLSVQVAPGA